MIKKTVKLSAAAICAAALVGCATSGDIANLQSQIDELKTQGAAAEQAAASAAAAEASAAAAAAAAEETNAKLDRMFKKSMSK